MNSSVDKGIERIGGKCGEKSIYWCCVVFARSDCIFHFANSTNFVGRYAGTEHFHSVNNFI